MIGRGWLLLAVALGVACAAALADAEPANLQPFEDTTWSTPPNVVDAASASVSVFRELSGATRNGVP